MSERTAAQQPPLDPNRKPPEKEKEGRLVIPAWWSIVALIMAGLVVLPIQYANLHSKKTAAQEEPQAKETVSQAEAQPKTAPTQEAAEPKAAVEQAEVQAKPAPAQEAAEPKAAVEQAEVQAKPAPAPADQPAAKQKEEQAEPVKPAAAEPAQAKPVEQAEAQPNPAAAPEDKPVKPTVEQAEPVKPAAAGPAKKDALVKLAEKQKVEDAIFYRIDGKDTQGRPASFDFIVLTNDYTWAKGSSSQVVAGGKLIPQTETADRVLAPKVRDSLARDSDLIAVGLASKDGKRTEEEARAVARSKTVATWIEKVAKPEIGLWTLTLGQYDKSCKQQEDKDSSFERPVLLIGVRSKAEGANLQEALADAISGHDNLPSRECYSRFDMAKIR